MTRVPGTLDSAQNDGHQAFQVTTSTWSIDIWSGRKQQITTSKKTTLGTKTSRVLQWGEVRVLQSYRVPILEP